MYRREAPRKASTICPCEHQESQMKNLETEMTDLKKTVSEIKTLLTRKPPDSGQPAQNSPITKSQEQMPKPPEELDGIRIRGIPESPEKKQEYAKNTTLQKFKNY